MALAPLGASWDPHPRTAPCISKTRLVGAPLAGWLQVVPLDWQEWLVSLAIGSGAFPLSFITRVLSHRLPCGRCGPDRFDAAKEEEAIHPGAHAAHEAAAVAKLSPTSSNRVAASPDSVGNLAMVAPKQGVANNV